MSHYTMWHYATLHYVTLCDTMSHYTMSHYVTLCGVCVVAGVTAQLRLTVVASD